MLRWCYLGCGRAVILPHYIDGSLEVLPEGSELV